MAALLRSSARKVNVSTQLNIFYDEIKDTIVKNKKKYPGFAIYPQHKTSHIKWITKSLPSDNVPIICADKEDMYQKLRECAAHMRGNNFALGMYNNGVYEVWKRDRQPCQGGEMRKYGITHDDCTRPDDPRPTDLQYPFPDGQPVAVSVNVNYAGLKDVVFSPDSVFSRAFTSLDNVEFLPNGLLFKDANLIDPTMFVFMINFIRRKRDVILNIGLNIPPNYKTFLALISSETGEISNVHKNYDDGYSLVWIDLKSFIKGGVEASKDLTGGSLGDRWDYNRPNLMRVFGDKSHTHLSDIADVLLGEKDKRGITRNQKIVDNLDKLFKR